MEYILLILELYLLGNYALLFECMSYDLQRKATRAWGAECILYLLTLL